MATTTRDHESATDKAQFHRSKYAAPIGGLFVLFALVGLISVIALCVQFTIGLLDNTAEKEKFEQLLTPMLMFDPVPFETVAQASPSFLLQSSLWSTLLGDKRESYDFDDLGRLMVSGSDVDVTCARLYGPEIKLEHKSFTDYVNDYVYDDEAMIYYAPVTSQTSLYTPSVDEVVKKGDLFTLMVGYIPPSNAWTQAISGDTNKPAADKFMIYEFRQVKDYYQLVALRDAPVGDKAEQLLGTGKPSSSSSSSSSAPQLPAPSKP